MTADVNSPIENQPITKRTANSAWLYRTIWRWHFYAGIFCIPFIISLAVTGSIFLFKPQIDAWVDASYANVKPNVESIRTTANEQIASALSAVSGSSFVNYQLPTSDTAAVVITVNDQGKRTLVYVNPFTLDVMKTIPVDDQFIRQVRTLHGELLAGNVGSILVELAGCWAIVLVITGLYLWWPRNAKGFAGVFYPRLRGGSRLFWRDIHAVVGVWIAGFTLFLLVSGLPWAMVWGTAFKEVRQMLASDSAKVISNEHSEHHAMVAEGVAAADWTVSREEERALLNDQSKIAAVNLSEQIVQRAAALQIAPPVLLSVARNDSGLWHVSSDHQNRPLRTDVWLDAESGEVVRQQGFDDKAAIDRVISIGVAAHEGQLFGWFNQLLGLFTAMGLLVMSLSGFLMWRKRKPAPNSLGAPGVPPQANIGKGVALIVLGLAAVLPLLAISLLSILIVEFAVLKRVVPVRKWLGLRVQQS